MAINLTDAVVYDEEIFPNCFTLTAESLNSGDVRTWEVSEYHDQRAALMEWIEYVRKRQIPMFGFFSLSFDYPLLHWFISNPTARVFDLYNKAQEIMAATNRGFNNYTIWERDRIAPQCDIFKVNHFDNKAKTTSLKALEINMRSERVIDMPVEVGQPLTYTQIQNLVIPYNRHDVKETKRFVKFCKDAIDFRIGMMETIKGDVLNFNDTKIGETLLEQRIGRDITHERRWISTGFNDTDGYWKQEKRQTVRNRIVINDIIFPYIRFNNPEFNRVLGWLRQQVLTPADIDDPDAPAQTKGVFKDVIAHVDGIEFKFGTGGMHASVKPQRIVANDEWLIRDIDVAAYYVNAAIVNKLAPAHLGEHYVRELTNIPIERKKWQELKGKKCVEANGLKLAGNGVYGKSNSMFSIFYDPQYTLTVTINCQLMICMLAEWLLTVPTLKIIQANTDGITYYIHRDHEPAAAAICKQWEKFTCLTLEDVNYKRMWIRDVNNYVAEPIKGPLKQKGAYWHPDPLDYGKSISEQQPPAWHKDLGNCISIRAAVAAMVYGIDPETFIRLHMDKFDFMCRVKVGRSDRLMLGQQEIQRTTRYYVTTDGQRLVKISPPKGRPGAPKKANGIDQREYERIMTETNWQWDARVCTKNKSVYANTETEVEAGWKVTECNDASTFRFDNIDYRYYVKEAQKLIIT